MLLLDPLNLLQLLIIKYFIDVAWVDLQIIIILEHHHLLPLIVGNYVLDRTCLKLGCLAIFDFYFFAISTFTFELGDLIEVESDKVLLSFDVFIFNVSELALLLLIILINQLHLMLKQVTLIFKLS